MGSCGPSWVVPLEKAATAGRGSIVARIVEEEKQACDKLNRSGDDGEFKDQFFHLTRLVSCGLLSSSLLRVFIGGSTSASLHPLLLSLPLLPVEAESGP